MKKVVFLTGATGTMGTQTVKKFMDYTDEFELRVLARKTPVNEEKLAPYADRLTIIWGDLLDFDQMTACMEGVDYVLHVGALLNPMATDYPADVVMRTNYGSTLAMLRGIKKFGQEEKTHFVYVGTVEEVGHRSPPLQWGRVGDPLQPPVECYYALSKVASERAVAESGLKYWVSVRQSFQHPNNPLAAEYPIIGMVPPDSFAEHIDSESSGNLMLQICRNAPEEFWGMAYNMGGGEEFRWSHYDYIKQLHGNARNGWEPKWLATQNYHGHFFSDSDRLNELVPYRLKNWQQFLGEEMKFQIKMIKSQPRRTPEESKAENQRICSLPGGTIWAVENNDEDHIRMLYGSREKYEAIPDTWDDIPIVELSHEPTDLDHGYDETKPVSQLGLEDMRQAAKFRGGECLSETMEPGAMMVPLRWRCGLGHEFEARPNTILKLGHWCPHCMNDHWNYFEQARVSPFFAQVWDYLHEGEEPYSYKMESDAAAMEALFE